MEIIKYIAGKSSKNDPFIWLPLHIHLSDTAHIMKKLVRYCLPLAAREATGLDSDEADRIAVFLACIHDIGKCTSLFVSTISASISGSSDILRQHGVNPMPRSAYIDARHSPHALAGGAILCELGCPAGIADVVSAHHGKPPSVVCDVEFQLEDYPQNYYGKEAPAIWRRMWEALLKNALALSGYGGVEELPQLSMQAQVLLTGLLIMADWIASNEYYFPLMPFDGSDCSQPCSSRAEYAWNRLSLPEPWASERYALDDKCFERQFGFEMNQVQRAVIDTVNRCGSPGIIILEAQMGVGKTEAALAATEVLAAKHGCGGVFFGMPSQATANGIFPRLTAWAQQQSEKTVHAVKLAHGAANLNAEYRELFHGNARISDDNPSGNLIVHEWFEGRKQALLADFVIGTVDQLLMAALRQKHVMLRHIGLAGKVVIIDECHAYDAYMSSYLDRTLNWLGAYNVPVMLLSATLPARRRAQLLEAYLNTDEPCGDENWQSNRGYPLLTWTEGNTVHQKAIALPEQKRRVMLGSITEDEVEYYLRTALSEGGCAVVIVNTVARAQSMAQKLEKAAFAEVILFHSRYVLPDRADIEKTVLRRFGKASTPAQREHLILVGTQVLEQSLDIDVDVLITELCPMDLLLQRIGRLHRHDLRTRPEKLEQARCMILKQETDLIGAGKNPIYQPWLLMRTQARLPKELILPDDIPGLIQDVYDDNIELLPDNAGTQAVKNRFRLNLKSKEDRAAVYRLPKPKALSRHAAANSIKGLLDSDKKADNPAAEAAVRDGDTSIEVLLMAKHYDGTIHFLPWQYGGAEVSAADVPSREEALKIAGQRLRLPPALCRAWNIDNTLAELELQNARIFAGWQQSPLLKGELVLLLNEDARASLSDHELCYTQKYGMICKKEELDE